MAGFIFLFLQNSSETSLQRLLEVTASVTAKVINLLIKAIHKKTKHVLYPGNRPIIRLSICWFSSCISTLSILTSSNPHHGWICAYFSVFLCIINVHGSPDNTACTCDLENICMWILPSNWTISRERDWKADLLLPQLVCICKAPDWRSIYIIACSKQQRLCHT